VPLAPFMTLAVQGLLFGMLLSQPLRDASGVVLLGLLFFERVSGGESPRIPTRWIVAVAAFLAANALSAWAGDDRAASVAELRFYPLGLLVFIGAHRVTRERWSGISAVVLVLVVLFAADTLAEYVRGTSWLRPRVPMWGRFQGALRYPSDISLLPFLLPIGAAALVGKGWWRLVAGAVVVALVAAAVSLSGTRSALAALLVIGAAAGWLQGRARLGLAVIAIALLAALGIARFAKATAPKRLVSAATYRDERRPSQWRAAMYLFRERPLLGHGPHSFKRILAERPMDPVLRQVDRRYAPYPHDIYLEALCGTGVIGFVTLVALLGLGLRSLYAARRVSAMARAGAASLSAVAAVGLFDLSLGRDWVQLCFWLPLGIACAFSSSGAESRDPPRPR
jgi:putative inorganic carbon (HCO3(-)) transporter